MVNKTAAYTVTELSLIIKTAIQKDPKLKSVTVQGEVSGFRHQLSSGHWYFSLKDEDAVISCILFYQNTRYAKIRPKDGDSVILTGYVNTYPKSSSYQICVTTLRRAGTGDVYQQLEELKKKLKAEGLFDLARKRAIPMVPKKVAVITSGSGAAWQDILNVSGARNPSIPIILLSVLVQGERASAEIAAAIHTANEQTDADVIIIARGGGAAEDLWCFNDETVARAVAASKIPVVSGVGHETDITLCDLAADVRAATPSNAAEIVFPKREELQQRINIVRYALIRSVEGQLSIAEKQLSDALLKMINGNPEQRISIITSRSELIRIRLNQSMDVRVQNIRTRLQAVGKDLIHASDRRYEQYRAAVLRMMEKMEAIRPLRVLERGYAIVTDIYGGILTGTKQAESAGTVIIQFADGSVNAEILKDGDLHHAE